MLVLQGTAVAASPLQTGGDWGRAWGNWSVRVSVPGPHRVAKVLEVGDGAQAPRSQG